MYQYSLMLSVALYSDRMFYTWEIKITKFSVNPIVIPILFKWVHCNKLQWFFVPNTSNACDHLDHAALVVFGYSVIMKRYQ